MAECICEGCRNHPRPGEKTCDHCRSLRPEEETVVDRIAHIAIPENFTAFVNWGWILSDELTWEEKQRLSSKMHLVERIAQKVAANLLKGTLKYPADEEAKRTPEEWLEYLKDDAIDSAIYPYLLEESWRSG